MKTVAYGLLLVLLLAGSLLLLRLIEPEREPSIPPPRLPGAVTPDVSTMDLSHLEEADADELYTLGVEFLQMWRVREATVVLEQAVTADSTSSRAWRKLIECYANPLIDNEDALDEAVDRARDTSPGDTTYVTALGCLYADRDYAGAITLLSAYVRTPKAEPDAGYHLALAYYRMGLSDDASRQLAPLMQRDATVGPVVELYIRLAVATRDFDRAGSAARELARMYTEEPFPYVLIAQVEMARGNPRGAIEFCNNAIQLDPRCIPAIMTRALLYADNGDYQAARVSFEKLMLFDELVLKSIGEEGMGFVDFLSGDFDEGLNAMDESIRQAMLAGATRRGLAAALRLVEYLCQLGQADAAEGVVERWITGFGDIPVRLARARIQVLKGDLASTESVLEQLTRDQEWVLWSRVMSLDVTELTALAEIGLQRQKDALELLAETVTESAGVAGADARRTFLAGYASFETGDAERAAESFTQTRQKLYALEFPYHGDPVLHVQALFFLAESELARGNATQAAASYEAFLSYWGDAAWDLEAVARARGKLDALGGVTPPQG